MRISRRFVGAPVVVLGLCSLVAVPAGQEAPPPSDMPVYRVDPFWPRMPLRNKWLIQGVPTMVTDHNDHVWALSRPLDIDPDESGAGIQKFNLVNGDGVRRFRPHE